jgi:Rrf2 family protein
MLSNKTKYALRAMLYIASRYSNTESVLSSEVAAKESIPRKFLEMILLQLKNKGLLSSRKGKGGGYLLTREPKQISFGDVIRVFEGSMAPAPCVEPGRQAKCPECQEGTACMIRPVMRELYNATVTVLDGMNLEQANENAKRSEVSSMYFI